MENRGLIFPFKDFIDECDTLKAYASEVLDGYTTWVLDEAKNTLESMQSRGFTEHTTRWSIAKDHPLCTSWSGESQTGQNCERKIRAKLSFAWDIQPFNEKKKEKKGKPLKHFVLCGLASTCIAVVDEGDQPLAQWTVDIGTHDSPGTHFHFQLGGSLDIPRLPAPVMSPFLAMEFVIGELFQDRWKKLAAAESPHTHRWRELHRERLQRFFDWQMKCVAADARLSGSPWMALKRAKPPSDLFIA